jgi:hypothetical protein
MKDIIYIVENEIVDKMNAQVKVLSFIDNQITVCDTKWARDGKTVTDSLSNAYTISSVDHGTNVIELTPNGAWSFSGETITLPNPKFFVGTPIATNEEWESFDRDERNKVPFIWMVEPTSETFFPKNSPFERQSEIRLVFLDSNNHEQWRTKITHKERLQSLYNMVEWFLNSIRSNRNYFWSEDLSYQTRNFTKFGKETSQGVDSNIIDAELTGIDVTISLKIKALEECKC